MDIHRCRFVSYPPSTINSVAFSKSHIFKSDKDKTAPPRLAIGRANGDIELWNPLKGSWLQETIIRGGLDRSIDGLVWTQDPNEEVQGKTLIGRSRLFSIGYTTTVTEWDLQKGKPLRNASGNHGEIWCIAAQPPLVSKAKEETIASAIQWPGQDLIAGCTDGALVLYSTKDEDLQLAKVLVRPSVKKAKIISIVFQDRNIVVAGCTDSIIRIYDIRNGTLVRNMSTGSGPKGGPKEIIIWSVKVLKDGTIVSGDSTGELKIWDGKTYTLRQRIKSHKQDILSLATSQDGSTIFSGGMDRRTVVYKPVSKGKGRWAEVAHRRFHVHDVKTMASFEAPGMSVVISGGPDAAPTVVPLGQFGFEHQRALPTLPQEVALRSALKQRLMMSWWEREVHIWRLSNSISGQDDHEPAVKGRKLVAKIFIKGEANIISAALSTDGSLISVATAEDVKVFHLRSRTPEEGEGLKISKVVVPSSFSTGARLLQFSPDGKWLSIIRSDSQIILARISPSSSSFTTTFHTIISRPRRIDRQVAKLTLLGGLGTYDRTITKVAFSANSAILAVSDLAGYVDTFVLEGVEDLLRLAPTSDSETTSSSESSDSEPDSDNEVEAKPKLIFGQHWTRNPSARSLPKLPSTPVVLSFRPAAHKEDREGLTNGATPRSTRKTPNPVSHNIPEGEERLLVVTATSDIFEFEVLKGGLSQWSKQNPTSAFPEDFRKLLEQVRGCIWDVKDGRERVWLYSIGWLWMFDLSQNFPSSTSEGTESSRKRKRLGAGGEIPNEKLDTGMSRKGLRIVHDEEIYEQQTLIDSDAMDIDDDEETDTRALTRLPGNDVMSEGKEGGKAQHWHTFKYRPILGIVEIGEGDEQGPEVAVVERPIWETDMPPRYYGDQEWKDKEIGIGKNSI